MAMQLLCGNCNRTLDYSGERPMFCSFCGNPLGDSKSNTPSNHDPDAATVAPSTMPGSAPARKPPAPAALGSYKLLRELGSGGMGTVYEALDSDSGHHVALKLIGAAFTSSPDAVERFKQEGLLASMLTHPRCVFVHKTDDEAGRPYIVMELMEGSSLKDLVERDGPLTPDDAIAKILDVIDGLQAAHRLDFIHRDMKPSNCFLEPDGRVKVGDFGLAKSLVKESHLTKTGAFVGTPHFASPEQVRGENIDQQTDVYSVAATLFYLLTGKPPFWGSDPTATLARIVSDPVPTVRSLRPDVPAALDRVVLRGLERDRARRWADLESMRQALLNLTPGRHTTPILGQRAAAFVFDCALLWLVAFATLVAVPWIELRPAILVQQASALFLAYFVIAEAVWGCSAGKALLGLRVCTERWLEPPLWGRVGLRTLVMVGLFGVGGLIVTSLEFVTSISDWTAVAIGWGWSAAGLAVMASTMRERNQWRGLHEIVSRTRVAPAPHVAHRQALAGSGGWLLSFLGGRRLRPGMPHGSTLPEKIAGFAVRGALKWSERDKVLLGEDASLGRRVFLWMRLPSAPPLDAARRAIGRRTRLRWLAAGRQGDWQWDAILAPQGCPLPEFIHSEGTLEWSEAAKLLTDLARELSAACADRTLPQSLSPALVWVQHDGRAQLADLALTVDTEDSQVTGGPDEHRALMLLRQVAALALDGRVLRLQETPAPVLAKLPPAAKTVLDRLLGVGTPYASVEEFGNALQQVPTGEHSG
ncbi:MAG: protein kinase [Gemmataceae bacterium]|nr:protein kinase [Gemmataceae bacterium]